MALTEEWRPIEGYQGIYDVSNLGHVRRHCGGRWKNGAWKTPWARPIKPWPKGPKGHLAVGLSRDGERVVRLVHRLVMAAFVGSCPNGMEVRHIDGDPTHNDVENLAYGTHSENERDKLLHGTHNHGSKTHCKWGHEFTPENTIRTTKQRHCRACRVARNAWRRDERRAA